MYTKKLQLNVAIFHFNQSKVLVLFFFEFVFFYSFFNVVVLYNIIIIISFPIRKLSVQILIFYASNMINVVGELRIV